MEKVTHPARPRGAVDRRSYLLGGAAVALTIAGMVLGVLGTDSAAPATAIGLAAVALAYAVSGSVLAARRPDNVIGWLMLAISLTEAILVASTAYALFAPAHPSLPWPAIAAWIGGWAYVPGLGLVLTFLLLLYPTGHPPTPSWRWVGWLAAVGLCTAVIGSAIALWDQRLAMLADPNGDVTPNGTAGLIAAVGMVAAFGVAGIASIVSLVVRWRRSRGDERQQLRWFLFAVAVAALGFAISSVDTRYTVLLTGMLLIPVAIAFAVLKYRLYDLDIVVKKTVVFLLIAAGLTVLSLTVLLVIPLFAVGTLTGWERGLFVVGVVIGTAFGPLRRWARRIADRLVYGKRATPYEVLAEFSGRLGATYADEDVTTRMAQLLREATGAEAASVWLSVDGRLQPVASSPGNAVPSSWPTDGIEVQYRGASLGGLSVVMPANDPLDPVRAKLISDLAGQAGPVLANVRLIEELRASRRRIVSSQDERAKKLERDIHDGAQQQLVALTVKLRLLEQIAERDGPKAKQMAAELQTDATGALEDLRDLARGIYPPLLADKGLGPALEAQARKAVVPTTVSADGVDRFLPEVESAVYFSCLEALQNIGKYAEASAAAITLSNGSDGLRFSVTDDGRGFDTRSTGYGTGLQGIADRLAAIGGTLVVASTPGTGTTITGEVPV